MQLDSEIRAPVPFLDLRPVHDGLTEGILAEIAELFESGAFTNGRQVGAFEEAFAAFCGARFCVGLASGLDAVRLALLTAGIEPGDEVIVPAATFVATWEAVTQAGGVPVPVEIGEDDLNLDPDAAAASVGPRTRFLLPVHLYGQLADMRRLAALAERCGLTTIEDACQAHGASRDGESPAARSFSAAFSFYPGKNLGAIGDAGALVLNDDEAAVRIRALREHGQRAKYDHELRGYTARLDTIQAIALLHKLPHLRDWNAERSRIAALYLDTLAGVGDLALPPVPAGSEPVWHLFVIRTAESDRLATHLRERQIATGRHYPVPPHLSLAYAELGHREGEFPIAERLSRDGLSLPLYPGMTDSQAESVVDSVRAFFNGA